jgi:hypothetical protein
VALGLLVLTAISIPFLSYFGLDSIAKPLFYSLHSISSGTSSAYANVTSPSIHRCSWEALSSC